MPDELPAGVVHIAGVDLQVGDQLRQRCGWCGAVLMDYDLANTMVALERCPICGDVPADHPDRLAATCPAPKCRGDGYLDPDPIGRWPVGELVSVDGGVLYVVEHTGGEELPANSCAKLPHDVTGAVERG